MQIHPACKLFPELEEKGLQLLAADIKKNGLVHPIVLLDGKILDGRNRAKACALIGLTPKTVPWKPSNGFGPEEYVISANVQRRHLTPGQCAAFAVQLLPALEREAKERQKEGGRAAGRGRPKGSGKAATTYREKSRDVAGRIVGVSGRMVADAVALKEKAPELHEAVKSGAMSHSSAMREAFPSVEKRVAADTEVMWTKVLADIWRVLASVKKAGGMAKLSRRWSDAQKQDTKKECAEIARRMRAFAEEL